MAVKTRRSVASVIAQSKNRPDTDWRNVSSRDYVRHDVADAALYCRELWEAEASLNDLWRFGVLQTLDYYNSAMKVGGVRLAKQVFTRTPAPTESAELDAAFAALAEYLAHHDGWTPPVWSADAGRQTEQWYVPQSPAFYSQAEEESPLPFRRRGVYITLDDLTRA